MREFNLIEALEGKPVRIADRNYIVTGLGRWEDKPCLEVRCISDLNAYRLRINFDGTVPLHADKAYMAPRKVKKTLYVNVNLEPLDSYETYSYPSKKAAEEFKTKGNRVATAIPVEFEVEE